MEFTNKVLQYVYDNALIRTDGELSVIDYGTSTRHTVVTTHMNVGNTKLNIVEKVDVTDMSNSKDMPINPVPYKQFKTKKLHGDWHDVCIDKIPVFGMRLSDERISEILVYQPALISKLSTTTISPLTYELLIIELLAAYMNMCIAPVEDTVFMFYAEKYMIVPSICKNYRTYTIIYHDRLSVVKDIVGFTDIQKEIEDTRDTIIKNKYLEKTAVNIGGTKFVPTYIKSETNTDAVNGSAEVQLISERDTPKIMEFGNFLTAKAMLDELIQNK